MPITILQLAEHRGAKADERGAINGEEFHRVGLAIMGGCQCTATIAAYNAYPSKSGYWRCEDCIEQAGDGYDTVQEANAAIFSTKGAP